MGLVIPTLEDLRNGEAAAWLWDAARSRLVWANPAGVAAFDGQSIFDVIDRRFDGAEPGIAEISRLSKTLTRGEIAEAELAFPSVGADVAFHGRCWLHALADGRDGVLVVDATPKPAAPVDINRVYDALPAALVFINRDGTLLQPSALATELYDTRKISHFEALLIDKAKAEGLLVRLAQATVVGGTNAIHGRLGIRDVNFTLRRLPDGDGPYAVALLDDITDRRNLERWHNPSPAAPAQTDAQAFEAVGKAIAAAVAEPAPHEVATVLKSSVAKFNIPDPMRRMLERRGDAFAIMQDDKGVYASPQLLAFLGYASEDAIAADESFWSKLSGSDGKTAFSKADGTIAHILVKSSAGPWWGKPARHYFFSPHAETPAPQPKPVLTVEVKEVDLLKPAPVVEPPRPSPLVSNTAADELKSILDIASDGIITLDETGNILSFSAGAEAMFGYRTSEVLGKPLADLMHADSQKALANYIAGLDGTGLASVFNDGREMTAVVKQGGFIPLFITIGRLQAQTSKARFCAIVRDITPWKRTEKELLQAKEMAETSSRQKSDFLASISHELRTPLNAILGFSEMMRDGRFGEIKNDRYRGYVNDIHLSGTHLLSLINDLLDLSKIEAGKMELNFTAVNLNDVIDHAMRLMQEQATRARVVVRRAVPENLPRVVADLRAMRQIVLNLLSNAVKFTEPGGQVIISAVVGKSGELTFRLKDSGIGMNAEEMKEALIPFKRVEVAGRPTQGTGLGLPLTKALVEANRAKFDISSEPGQGTAVEITFPTTRVLAE